jgi:hypothetical protein
MTIRPFKITNGNLFITRIQTHRGEDLIKKSIKIPRKFWKKLLSYPITAFGYGIDHPPENKELPNPKFDRTDVIKALDFWIEHWVYQNKKDYILEGTVNKDFELTVRELIETREAVLKIPVDTQFVRQKIRTGLDFEREYSLKFTGIDGKEVKHKRDPKEIVEFTENVLQYNSNSSSSASTVDQFCYVVRRMTYKEYMKRQRQYEFYIYNINFRDNGQRFNFGGLDDELSPMMWGGQHTDNGNRDFSMMVTERLSNPLDSPNFNPNIPATSASGTDQPSLVFENMHLSSIDGFSFSADPNTSMTVPVDGTNPNNWVVVDSITSPNTFRIVNTDGVNIAGGFNTRLSAELYLINARESFLPSEIRKEGEPL